MTQYKFTIDTVVTFAYEIVDRRHWVIQYVDFVSPISNENKKLRMVKYVAEDEETVILYGKVNPEQISKVDIANEIAIELRKEVENMEDINEKRKQEFLDSLKGEFKVSVNVDLEAGNQIEQN